MRTINLLPKPKQQELKYEAIYHSLVSLLWVSVFSFVIVFFLQYSAKIYLQYQAQQLAGNISRLTQEVNKQDNAAVKQKITEINNVFTDYKNLSDQNPRWSNLLKVFVPLVPANVHITSLVVDNKTRTIQINGFSPTRELVIALYNNILADSTHFSGIDYPLENVAKPTNINFHFTFMVQDSVLQ
jgi:Tfp pilus assembly protein PilN